MYAELGSESSDTGKVTITYGDTTSTQFNVFVQQIECDNPARYYVKQFKLDSFIFRGGYFFFTPRGGGGNIANKILRKILQQRKRQKGKNALFFPNKLKTYKI